MQSRSSPWTQELETAFFLEVFEDRFHRAAWFLAAFADGFEVNHIFPERLAHRFIHQRRDALVGGGSLDLESLVKVLFKIDGAGVLLFHANNIITL